MLSPVGLVAQTALPTAPVPAQAAVYDSGGQTQLGDVWGLAPATWLPFSRESRAIYDDDVFSVNQQRVGDAAHSFRPSIALLEMTECQRTSFNNSSFSLLCSPINRLNKLNQGIDPSSSYRSGAAFRFVRGSNSNVLGGDQPIPGEEIASEPRLPTDLDLNEYTSPATAQSEIPGLDELHSRGKKRDDMAFQTVAPQSGRGGKSVRGKAALVVLGLAVHAAVTWDAQSTNNFFHHYPAGYRPSELDPLMRPFAGRALMYPMANLLFAAPADLVLFKTRHSQKPIRILTYAAVSFWVGLEIHQSIANIGNEHIRSSR